MGGDMGAASRKSTRKRGRGRKVSRDWRRDIFDGIAFVGTYLSAAALYIGMNPSPSACHAVKEITWALLAAAAFAFFLIPVPKQVMTALLSVAIATAAWAWLHGV
jgi:hypothetical protein